MRRFDVAHHQPHPPGYPVFILAAKATHALVPSEPVALGALSAVSAAAGLIALVAFASAIVGSGTAALAALLTATTPLYWFTAARPLSDSLGLAAAIAVQALIVRAHSSRALSTAALLAGLAAGIRSQVLWLTVPLLLLRHAPPPPPAMFPSGLRRGTLVAFSTGLLLWLLPLVFLSGGPRAYWHALFDQGAEDLADIRMLWTSPTLRTLVEALYYAFVAPWATSILAVPVVALAVGGLVTLWRRNRVAVGLIVVAFAPYFCFDLLFQETFTVRYALPVVVPVALLAASAISAMPQRVAMPLAIAVAMYGAHIGGRSIAAYSRRPAPAFRMLADMRASEPVTAPKPVLAPDRRASFDLRRPMAWLGPDAPGFETQLQSPPQHEWREAVNYWNGSGTAPVWFVVDPRRTAMDLIQHREPRTYRYALPFPALMSGTRPADVDWYQIDRPDWYVGDGWALTPEAAGVSQELASRSDFPRQAWMLRKAAANGSFILGGRNFGRPVELTGFAGRSNVRLDQLVPSGPFLIARKLPEELATESDGYLPVSVRPAAAFGDVALEQFDVSSSRAVLGFGTGWHEREFNPATGQLWRWLSDRGEIIYMTNGRPATLRISGETPLRYYSKGSRLVVRDGQQVLAEMTVAEDFTFDVSVRPTDGPATLVVETDQIHVPAEQGWRRSLDRRRLGLRIYSCAFVESMVSAPDKAASFPPAR